MFKLVVAHFKKSERSCIYAFSYPKSVVMARLNHAFHSYPMGSYRYHFDVPGSACLSFLDGVCSSFAMQSYPLFICERSLLWISNRGVVLVCWWSILISCLRSWLDKTVPTSPLCDCVQPGSSLLVLAACCCSVV